LDIGPGSQVPSYATDDYETLTRKCFLFVTLFCASGSLGHSRLD